MLKQYHEIGHHQFLPKNVLILLCSALNCIASAIGTASLNNLFDPSVLLPFLYFCFALSFFVSFFIFLANYGPILISYTNFSFQLLRGLPRSRPIQLWNLVYSLISEKYDYYTSLIIVSYYLTVYTNIKLTFLQIKGRLHFPKWKEIYLQPRRLDFRLQMMQCWDTVRGQGDC